MRLLVTVWIVCIGILTSFIVFTLLQSDTSDIFNFKKNNSIQVFASEEISHDQSDDSTRLISYYKKKIVQKDTEILNLKSKLSQLETEIDQINQLLEGGNQNPNTNNQIQISNFNTPTSSASSANTNQYQASTQLSDRYPFVSPTSGYLGNPAGGFMGQLYDMTHYGVDIWTTLENGGKIENHRGNPVVSACSGVVGSMTPANGGVSIDCDPIPKSFNVPEYDVITHYAHLGHAVTKELYIEVKTGQRVTKGQLIGYQGDISSFFPEMRNVHLHFSVFTGYGESDPNGGAIDPCLYIGGNCTLAGGTKFEAGKNST